MITRKIIKSLMPYGAVVELGGAVVELGGKGIIANFRIKNSNILTMYPEDDYYNRDAWNSYFPKELYDLDEWP